VIDRLQGFFGFTRMPFGRDLAPGMLHRHAAHGEAVARIGWCVTDIGNHRNQNLLNGGVRVAGQPVTGWLASVG
jgi:type II secretory pathway predicted ATPase ExeA